MGIVSLGVLGSGRLDDERVAAAIRSAAEELGAARIVTAYESGGVCQRAKEYAAEAGLELLLHPLPLDRGQGQYHWRNEAVIGASTRVLLLHDGEQSRQAAAELRQVEKSGKPWDLKLLEPLTQTGRRGPNTGTVRVVRRRQAGGSRRG